MSSPQTIDALLRADYKAFRDLMGKLEAEAHDIPVPTLFEVRCVVDHMMRVAQGGDPESELHSASAHLARGARDIYLALLTPRLERIDAISQAVSGREKLEHFAEGYKEIRNIVQASGPDSDETKPAEEYLAAIQRIDEIIDSFAGFATGALAQRKMRLDRYRNVLIAILFALLGAVISILVNWLINISSNN